MTKSKGSNLGVTAVREPRPFLYLLPAPMPLVEEPTDAIGLALLTQTLQPQISQIVRGLVDYTIARQNEDARVAQPIQISVLNRRRRAARSWLLAISEGRIDTATRHAVASQWLPLLCGTGPDLELAVTPARGLVEYVRGAITACIFDGVCANLLPQARASHVLETTMAVHLAELLRQASASDRALLAPST